MKLAMFDTVGAAMQAAKKLPNIDWSLKSKSLKALSPKAQARIKKALRDSGGRFV